ncbi:MAG: glycerol kinase GlpK [Acidobacteriota bacterium]
MARFVLGLDQGTTGTTALLLDGAGAVVSRGYREIAQHYPRPAWVEHDPDDIWASCEEAMRAALDGAGARFTDVAAIGITNQRETVVAWDARTSAPLHRAIVWQCRRTAEHCDRLKASGAEEPVRAKTGLKLDAYFSGTKIAWLCANAPAVAQAVDCGRAAFGTIDSWVLWKLTGGKVHATDPSNASRTMLYDVHARRWDDELRATLSVPASVKLPEVKPSGGVFGTTDPAVTGGAAIPVAAILGDQQAALYGQGCWEPGSAKVTFGTGAFLLMNLGTMPRTPPKGLLLTIAADAEGRPVYALEGSVFIAGAAIQWLRDGLGIITTAAETQALAESIDDTGGVYFVPAFVGLGAPYWDQGARGAILGLTRGSSRAHIARAALEAIAYQSRDVLDAMKAGAGLSLSTLRVDGGAAANDFLCGFLAGICNVPVDRPASVETTGLGAAYLAGAVVGFYDATGRGGGQVPALKGLRRTDRVFAPAMSEASRDALYGGWRAAVERVATARPASR